MAVESSEAGSVDFSRLDAVQELLDENRKLLREIKQNQEHQSPQSLANNFYLIRELNGNIEKVMSLYQELSADFVQFMNNNEHNTSSPEVPSVEGGTS